MERQEHRNGATSANGRLKYLALGIGAIAAGVAALFLAWPSPEPAKPVSLREEMPDLREIERRRTSLWVTVDLAKSQPDPAYVASAGANLNRIATVIAAGASEAQRAETLHVVFFAEDSSTSNPAQRVRFMRVRIQMGAVREFKEAAPGQFNSLELIDQVSTGSSFGDAVVADYCEYYRARTPRFCEIARK